LCEEFLGLRAKVLEIGPSRESFSHAPSMGGARFQASEIIGGIKQSVTTETQNSLCLGGDVRGWSLRSLA
jgi:hypothetical protein